ncbi:MAG: hypothetical protein ACRELY_14960 [Polyangiaceae bacterium]
MATIIQFRCARFELDDLGDVVEASDLQTVLDELRRARGVVVLLVGPNVKPADARKAIDAVVRRDGYFLRARASDKARWIRRLLRMVLKRA